MAISKLQNFYFFLPLKSKKKLIIFGETFIKLKKNGKLKTEYMSLTLRSTISMPNVKEIHQYLVPKTSKNLQKLRILKLTITFFGSFRQLTDMNMVSLNWH